MPRLVLTVMLVILAGCASPPPTVSSSADAHLFRVIVPVNDIDQAAEFYGTLLGTPGERVSPGRHYFDCGGTVLACYDLLADGDRGVFRPNPEHVYLSVRRLEPYHARAKDLPSTWVEDEIARRPWGERSFYLVDPFGNRVCFVDARTAFTGN